MKKIATLLAATLVGCGGGSSVDNTTTSVPLSSASISTLLFNTNPQLLPDLRSKYNQLCKNNVSVQHVVPANLTGHKDGKKDLIFSLWCAQDDSLLGSFTTAPVINGMVAFIQQSNGEFIDGTQIIFNTDMVDLGGNGGEAVVYDFNKDGYDDIVWGTSPEDGRLEPDGYTGSYIQKVFMTSKGNGQYSIEKLGQRTKTNHLQLMDNEEGSVDVVSTFTGYFGYPEVWRYSNGWKLISSGYDSKFGWISNSLNIFFKRKTLNENSHIAISESRSTPGIDLYATDGNFDNWVKKDNWNFGGVTSIPIVNADGTVYNANLVSFKGKDYLNPTFQLGCELQRKTNESSVGLAFFTGAEIVGGFKGGTLVKNNSNLKPITKMIAFSTTNNKLTETTPNLKNEITELNVLKVECLDKNNDGYDDIIIYPLGKNAKPIIYLNDGLGNFTLVDNSKFPIPSSDYFDTSMTFSDIDGNGTSDLIYFPANRLNGNPDKVQYQLFRGMRALGSTDLSN